ncbi:hypothetical protein N7508_004377 [Penicillium antarcticum]|nr:uncharacterized protein N7508_004377 [Penicillium antarcticum]KAJ5308998.1 hypothetical protein N7508_004377 [Penicillium antarcticum]
MMRPRDPRIRQRINQISHNLESANETAQEGLYAFSHNYISPCFESIGSCVNACTAPCLPSREDHLRRRRRGRAEANFDFYDDWENEEEDDGLLGWGTGELDRLLAGSGLARGSAEQPHRPRRMSYGTRNTRRRSTVHIPDNHNDPTVIPSSSFIGFLERFPWRFGARGVKYRPSAADLQEHPGTRRYAHEDEPLMEAMDNEAQLSPTPAGRNRSATQSSRGTSNSLSSRGDLFPSDEEEDAVPLDDEFAITFTRRGTGLESDDQSGTKSEFTKSGSASSLGGASSKKNKRKNKRRTKRFSSSSGAQITEPVDTPSMADLKTEDQRAALEEEAVIERRRLAAQELALNRGLDSGAGDMIQPATKPTNTSLLPQDADKQSIPKLRRLSDSSGQEVPNQTEPFPALSLSPSSVGLETQDLSKASPRPLSPFEPDHTNARD